MEEEGRSGRVDGWASKGWIDEAADGELDVANGFCGGTEAWGAGEKAIFGIVFEVLGFGDGRLLVGGAGGDEAVDVFHGPVVFHEFNSKPVEEFWMGRARALKTKVFRGFDKSGSKVSLPDAVDESASGGG